MLLKKTEIVVVAELLALVTYEDRQVLDLLLPDIIAAEKISEGMTNLNYKVTSKGDVFVVRVPGRGTATFIDRSIEWENYHAIAPLDITAEEVYYNKQTGLRITKYIDNLYPALNRIDKARMALGPLMKVHRSGICMPARFTGPVMLGTYEKIAAQYEAVISRAYYRIKHQVSKSDKYACLDENTLAPCHNDPVSENFIMDKQGKVYLIDWEYGGLNDPVWDLAALVLEMGLDITDEETILQFYFETGSISDEIRHRMIICKLYQDLLWYTWALIKTKNGSDLNTYALNRLHRATENVHNL